MIEMLISIGLIGISFLIVLPITIEQYEKNILELTAYEVKSNLWLAKEMSQIDSKRYCVAVINNGKAYEIREDILGSNKVIQRKRLPHFIQFDRLTQHRKVAFTPNGRTGYAKFILMNDKNLKIHIHVSIGTNRIYIQKDY